jgi:hypothetical protein
MMVDLSVSVACVLGGFVAGSVTFLVRQRQVWWVTVLVPAAGVAGLVTRLIWGPAI